MNELINFRRYAQEELTQRLFQREVSIEKVSQHEYKGTFFFEIYAWVDGKLCIGVGESYGKTVDDAVSRYHSNYKDEYQRVSI